eukprot:CAMPEP_0176437840 /NCGR_PEP_ID=MMETSP0127-20121128/18883_1 /TAXON_ID=938130 /ORGANISM="Platyophrya macrostoma, Strain WH" /LENGTH=228 /DNA_ID=CAMNT_0017821587 /DNA_START=177 /DNA_END=863 /DNA_ORIENTATION=+
MCMQPLGGSSHYRDTYTPKKGDREPNARPRAPPLCVHVGPEHFATTYGNVTRAVASAPMDRVMPYRPQNIIAPPAPFDGKTTQRTDFPGHMPKVPPRPPAQFPLPKVPGTYDTTLGAMQQPVYDAIRNGTLERAHTAGRMAKALPHLPFDGNTTYKVHYPPKHADHPSAYSPRAATAGVRENRDFISTKALSYPAPPIPKVPECPAARCPIRPASRDGHIKLLAVNDV